MKAYERTSADFDTEPRKELVIKCDEINAQLRAGRTSQVHLHHKIGRKIHEIFQNPDEYGDNHRTLKHIANLTGIPEAKQADYARIAKMFSEDQVESLLKRADDEGLEFSFKHLIALSHVASKKKRGQLIERMFKEKISGNRLHEEIFAQFEARRKAGGGRKPKQPTSPMAGFRQMQQATQSMANKIESIWSDVLNKALEASADKIDEAFQKNARETKESWIRTHQYVKNMIEHFAQLEARFDRINKRNASVGVEDDDDGSGSISTAMDEEPAASVEVELDDDPFGFHQDELDPEHVCEIS